MTFPNLSRATNFPNLLWIVWLNRQLLGTFFWKYSSSCFTGFLFKTRGFFKPLRRRKKIARIPSIAKGKKISKSPIRQAEVGLTLVCADSMKAILLLKISLPLPWNRKTLGPMQHPLTDTYLLNPFSVICFPAKWSYLTSMGEDAIALTRLFGETGDEEWVLFQLKLFMNILHQRSSSWCLIFS